MIFRRSVLLRFRLVRPNTIGNEKITYIDAPFFAYIPLECSSVFFSLTSSLSLVIPIKLRYSETFIPRSSRKYRSHNIRGIRSSTPTSSLRVQFLLRSNAEYRAPRPVDIIPPVRALYITVQTANDCVRTSFQRYRRHRIIPA